MPSAALLAMYPGWSVTSHPQRHQKHHHSRKTFPLELYDLSASDISCLTTILSKAPPASLPATAYTVQTYRTGTKSLIQALPASLTSPIPCQAQIVSWLNSCGAECPRAAKLCKLHRPLNAQLVSDILGRIKDEVEGHLPRILRLFPPSVPSFETKKSTWPAWPARVEKKKEDSPEEGARKVLLALQAVHGMYVSASTFRSLYTRDLPARCACQADECAACILARIGSDAEALVGLRALFLGRGWSDAKVRKSKRLLWVESWIMGFGAEAARGMLERSEKVGETVQRMRKEKKREGMEVEGEETKRAMEDKDEEGECPSLTMHAQRYGMQIKARAQELQSDIDSSSSTLLPNAPPDNFPTAAPRPCSSVYSTRHSEIQFIEPVAANPLHHGEQKYPLSPRRPLEDAQPRPRPSSSIYSRGTHDFGTDNRTSRTSLPQHRLTTALPLQPVHEDAGDIPNTPTLSVSTYQSESASEWWHSNPHLSSKTSCQEETSATKPNAHPTHNADDASRPAPAVYSAYLTEHEDFLASYMQPQPRSPNPSDLHLPPSPPTIPTSSKPHQAESVAKNERPNVSTSPDTNGEEANGGIGGVSRRDTQWQRFMQHRWGRWSTDVTDQSGS